MVPHVSAIEVGEDPQKKNLNLTYLSMVGNADEGRSIFGVIPNWVVAVAVSCFGSLLTVSGFVLQKQAVQAPKGRRPWPKVGDIVFSPRWMIGFFLAGVLPLPGALIAYALAPISLLAPLSGFTILVNFVVAPWLLGEKLQLRADVVASMCILVGIVLTTTTGNHDHGETSAQMNLARLKDLFIQDVFIIAFICLIIIVLAVSACIVVFQNNIEASAAARQMNPPVHHMLLPATLYAGFGCLTNIGLKAVAELMTAGASIFVIGAVAIIGVAPCAYLQLNFLNRGLRLYLQVIFFPVASALLIVTITLYGALFYEEYKTFEGAPIRCVLFCAGVLLVVIGINMFQFRKHQHNQVVDSTTAPASSNEIKQGNWCSSLHPAEISNDNFSAQSLDTLESSTNLSLTVGG